MEQTGKARPTAAAPMCIASLRDQLGFLLRQGYELQDEKAAWLCIMLFREQLRHYPSKVIADCHPKARLGYLSTLLWVRRNLDRHAFCEACNELSDLVYLYDINRAEIRDNILDLLGSHESLSQDERSGVDHGIFAKPMERKQDDAPAKPCAGGEVHTAAR